jgi:hypothetical protein
MAFTKPNVGPHYGVARPRYSFANAMRYITANPRMVYYSTGNSTPFQAKVKTTASGNHRGEQVIVFISDKKERARAYACCWGHKTNCNKTHIDCYTLAI